MTPSARSVRSVPFLVLSHPSCSNDGAHHSQSNIQHGRMRILDASRTKISPISSQDPAYFATRQADVSHRYRGSPRYKYITHNAKLTLDGKPMKCQDLPRGFLFRRLHSSEDLPCPSNCNCPLRVNEEGKRQRPWTDMEKFIFLNGFFNRPKVVVFSTCHVGFSIHRQYVDKSQCARCG